MKENIKLHVIELFKRHQIEDSYLEKELILALEEKYEEILKETDNEITSFNKTISLIGNIDQIKSEKRIILKELKKDISYEDKKKINKFSKIIFIITCITYLIFSLAFNSWLTSWLILFLSILVVQLYKVFIGRKNNTKMFNYVNYIVNILSILVIIFTVSVGAFMTNYDYKFDLKAEYIQKQYKFSNNLDELDINLIKSDLFLKFHDENSIIVNQYAKNEIKDKFKFTTSYNNEKLIISENKTSLFFSKYYYSVYEVLIPKNINLKEINLYGISSDFYLDLNENLAYLNVESTSGNIELNGNESGIKQNIILKTLKGKIDVKNLYANLLELSSTSGYITLENSIIDDASISSYGGNIILNKLMVKNLIVSSNSGTIDCQNSMAKFDLQSKNGAININNIMPLETSNIKTENGNILFTFDVNRVFNLEVKTLNGQLINEYYDDLDGINININSINGNINILMNEKD